MTWKFKKTKNYEKMRMFKEIESSLMPEAFEKNRLELRITITEAEQARAIFSRLSELEPDDWNRLLYPAQFSR